MALTRIRNTAITLDAAEIPNISADKITSGTLADARISSSSVVQHSPETDLQPVKADITALALREATNESSAAFNLPNQFIETFTDDTNLGTQTTCNRDSGYMKTETTTTGAFSNDANTLLLCHMDGSDSGTTFTDSSSTGHTLTAVGNAHTDTTIKKFGTASYQGDGSGDYVKATDHADWDIKTNWTIECWSYLANLTGDKVYLSQVEDNSNGWYFRHTGGGDLGINFFGNYGSTGYWGISTSGGGHLAINTWQHVACTKSGNDYTLWIDGTSVATTTNSNIDSYGAELWIGRANRSPAQEYDGYIDEVRISDVCRYTTTFTPNSTTTINATGTLIQSANTVGSAKTKVGGTLLYKDNAGTNTLGTDLKVYMTCNGGTNWTEAASYNAVTPVYSTGVKQVRLGETTCTSGTDVRYKCEWANQASGTKEAQVHGIGINY
jgi:hypothetical protein